MHRRSFLVSGSAAALGAATLATRANSALAAAEDVRPNLDPGLHRFGVNYTPSHNWWFCWNDWNGDPIRRDLDAIAALGADHLRLMLIWPYFQPNLKWVSEAHLEHFDQLLTWMEDRKLDALVTAFTGQLSGWYFLPPFNKPDPALYNDTTIWQAQELYVRALAATMRRHRNIIGFDFGNEMNTCWKAETTAGDAWMSRMFALMHETFPAGVHVNGVDHNPWFHPDTFSPRALAAAPLPVVHCYPFWTRALDYGGWMDPPSTQLMCGMAALVRTYAGNPRKPVWAGEFNTCIEPMPEKQQAEWLETAVTSAIESGVGWFTYWDSHDVNRKFAFHPVEYSLGLLTNDGRVKEQGRVFKQLAEAHRGKPVRTAATVLPPPPEHNFMATWQWILDYLQWKPKRSS
jgi:hypothetical protein